jgi:hypothetical protein
MMCPLIEPTLELWASSLRDIKAHVCGLFMQERVAASAILVEATASHRTTRSFEI